MGIADNTALSQEEKLGKLELYIKRVEASINEVRMFTRPQEIEQQIKLVQDLVYELKPKVELLIRQMDKLIGPSSIKTISDKDLYELWMKSGVTQKSVANDFSVSLQTAGKYCNGDIKDLSIRHKLREYFLAKIDDTIKIEIPDLIKKG